MVKIIRMVVMVVTIGLIAFWGLSCQNVIKDSGNATTEVASIDKEDVLKLSAFNDANAKINQRRMEIEKQFAKEAKGLKPEQQQELYLKYKRDLDVASANEVKPLLDRAQAAIDIVAREKKMKVVLDKKIVVCGATDITDDVKEKFKAPGELKASTEEIGQDSQIGYFDQEVVRSLKMFREADRTLYEDFNKMKKDIDDKVKNLPPEQREKVFNEYNAKLVKKRQEMYAPLLKKVTDIVDGIAKDKNLILVLDKQFVMFGGRNVTDEVVKNIGEK